MSAPRAYSVLAWGALAMGWLPAVAAYAAAPATQSVAIRNFAFAPRSVTVRAGTRVEWTNFDEEPHLITSAGRQFSASPALDTGERYAVTFATPGTYAYYCAIHPMMVGTIIVQ